MLGLFGEEISPKLPFQLVQEGVLTTPPFLSFSLPLTNCVSFVAVWIFVGLFGTLLRFAAKHADYPSILCNFRLLHPLYIKASDFSCGYVSGSLTLNGHRVRR